MRLARKRRSAKSARPRTNVFSLFPVLGGEGTRARAESSRLLDRVRRRRQIPEGQPKCSRVPRSSRARAGGFAFRSGGGSNRAVKARLLAHLDLDGLEDARRVDADTNARILAFTNTLSGEQACGAVAINGLLSLARERKAKISALSLLNSGDTAGDHSRVVGYGAYAIHDDRLRRPQ